MPATLAQREYFAVGSAHESLSPQRISDLLDAMLGQMGPLGKVLLVPPDITRFHSGAGAITVALWSKLQQRGAATVKVLPALGTHVPMTAAQQDRMYPGIPYDAFIEHHWRTDLAFMGLVPGTYLAEISGGRVDYTVRCQVNSILAKGGWDRIFSIGQLVPHEVIGIANQNKNILVGTGGKDVIDKSHFLGAVCNMESIMGRAETPVRALLDYMDTHFTGHLPITYLLTVRAKDASGTLVTRGFYGGDGKPTYRAGAALAQQVNLDRLATPLRKVVVYLDPEEFHSTWLGNKAIYRTRMAIADGGELIILAPGVKCFGEDKGIDALIRRYGYRTTAEALRAVREDPAGLGASLSAAAHLIHGSSEGRFSITYCPGHLTREEVESVGYRHGDLREYMDVYHPERLKDGWNADEQLFFIRNPALGLWALKSQFPDQDAGGDRN
jgi:nickel-dependent lactate racemase